MARILFLSLFLMLLPDAGSAGQTDLKNQIEAALREEGLSGAVWAVVENGIISTDAGGLKSTDTGEALTPGHRVHIGSITKTILATGILRLVTEGKLKLDDPVERHLKNLHFDNPWGAATPSPSAT